MNTQPDDPHPETVGARSDQPSGKRRYKLDIPAFLKPLPGQPEEVWVEEDEEGPLPPETDDAYPCWKKTPKWEGELYSPCIVEVARLEAFRKEHGAICGMGLDRIDQAWRHIFCIVTVYCQCGASKELTHDGHH